MGFITDKTILSLWAKKSPIDTVNLPNGGSVDLLDDNDYYAGLVRNAAGEPTTINFSIETVAKFRAWVATLS